MDDDLNVARHILNVTPMLRTVMGPQRSPAINELVPGSGTWTRNRAHMLALVRTNIITKEDTTYGV